MRVLAPDIVACQSKRRYAGLALGGVALVLRLERRRVRGCPVNNRAVVCENPLGHVRRLVAVGQVIPDRVEPHAEDALLAGYGLGDEVGEDWSDCGYPYVVRVHIST